MQTEIEDHDGRALAAFYARLARTERGEGQTRIAFFGDSHTATDRFPGRLRLKLQDRFGRAGAGLVMPGRPRSWYRHQLAVIGEHVGWATVSAGRRARAVDARVGLSGFALTTRWRKPLRVRFGRFGPRHEAGFAARFELHFLARPGGGRLRVALDGRTVAIVPTDAEAEGFARHRFTAADGRHRLTIAGMGDGPVTVLGVVAERERPGVIVDTLGIVGARAREQLAWDDAVYAAQLSARRPDLVVLAYGTNEAMDPWQPIALYEAELDDVVARVRRVVPEAACLLVGPTDHPQKHGRRYRDRPRTGEIIRAQRRVAGRHGCAMFDLVQVTGGPLSMPRLVRRRPFYGAPDHIHFTRQGYAVLGDALTGALMRGYGRWRAHHCSSPPG